MVRQAGKDGRDETWCEGDYDILDHQKEFGDPLQGSRLDFFVRIADVCDEDLHNRSIVDANLGPFNPYVLFFVLVFVILVFVGSALPGSG